MKKLLGIIVLGLVLQGCVTTESLVSSDKFKKDMSKHEFSDVFSNSYLSDTPLYPDGGSEFFASSGNEIVWAPNRKQFFVFKNVSEPVSCGTFLCKIGNGTLASWHSTLDQARASISESSSKKTATTKTTATKTTDASGILSTSTKNNIINTIERNALVTKARFGHDVVGGNSAYDIFWIWMPKISGKDYDAIANYFCPVFKSNGLRNIVISIKENGSYSTLGRASCR